MTSAGFDTRRRLLGLSIQEAADYFGVQRRTVERWISGYSDVSAGAVEKLEALEDRINMAVDTALEIAERQKPDVVQLKRYRSQAAVEASHYAAGMPLGAHAILIGWIADALEAAGFAIEISWGD